MANEYMKKRLMPLAIRDIQIKTRRYHFTHGRMDNIKNKNKKKTVTRGGVGRHGKMDTFRHC